MTDLDPLAVHLLGELRGQGSRLALAESCTGGIVSATLSAVPGASDSFWGGVVAYSAEAKSALADVPPAVIEAAGPVSAETTAALARGLRQRAGVEFCGAVTGWAGPSSAGPDPVGTVYIAVAGPSRCAAEKRGLNGGRDKVRREAARELLVVLLREVVAYGLKQSQGES